MGDVFSGSFKMKKKFFSVSMICELTNVANREALIRSGRLRQRQFKMNWIGNIEAQWIRI